MAHITGSGCMSSVMLGAFLGTEATIEAAAACCSFIGLCGEAAAEKTKECQGGTMTFRNAFIDEVSLMTPEKIYDRYQEKQFCIPDDALIIWSIVKPAFQFLRLYNIDKGVWVDGTYHRN